MKHRNSYSPELRERAVQLVLDQHGEHDSQWAAIISVSPKIDCAPETPSEWMWQAEQNQGRRQGLSSAKPSSRRATRD